MQIRLGMTGKTERAIERFLIRHPLAPRLRALLEAVVEGDRDHALAIRMGGSERLQILEEQFFRTTGSTVYDAAMSIHTDSLRPPSMSAR